MPKRAAPLWSTVHKTRSEVPGMRRFLHWATHDTSDLWRRPPVRRSPEVPPFPSVGITNPWKLQS